MLQASLCISLLVLSTLPQTQVRALSRLGLIMCALLCRAAAAVSHSADVHHPCVPGETASRRAAESHCSAGCVLPDPHCFLAQVWQVANPVSPASSTTFTYACSCCGLFGPDSGGCGAGCCCTPLDTCSFFTPSCTAAGATPGERETCCIAPLRS